MKKLRILGIVVFVIAAASFGYFKYEQINSKDNQAPVITMDDGYFVPYLYVVLENGYTVEDITEAVQFCLELYMFPVEILAIDERPFFHFKTNRIELSKELKKKSSIAE